MPGEVIQPVWNEDILVNVKRRCDALCEDVGDVIVAVGAIVEFRSKGSLPLLGLHDT